MKEQIQGNPLNEFLTEKEVIDLLGLSKTQIDGLRYKGLPFCRLTQTSRMYLVADIVEFIKSKKMVLRGENTETLETDAATFEDDGGTWKETEEG